MVSWADATSVSIYGISRLESIHGTSTTDVPANNGSYISRNDCKARSEVDPTIIREGAKKSIKRVRVPKNPMAGVVAGDSTENSTSHSTATDGVPAPGGKSPPYQPGAHGSTPEELGLEAVDFGFSEFGNVRYGTFPPAALRRPDITSNAGDCCPYIATYSSCVLDGLRPERRIPGGLYHDCLRTTNPGYTRVIPTDTFGFYNQGGVARNPGRGSGWAEYRVGARVLRRHACSSVHQNRTGVVRKAGGDPGERGAWG